MTRLDWEAAKRREAEKEPKPKKKKRKPKRVHPNSTAAKKWGRRLWK